jgi:hypothetical protein
MGTQFAGQMVSISVQTFFTKLERILFHPRKNAKDPLEL